MAMEEFDTDVVVVGAGPTGLMLAGELNLAGVSTMVFDRLVEPMQQSRALGFSARTIEELAQRGLLSRFGDLGVIPMGHFGGMPIDYRVVEGGNFGVRGVPQSFTESVLADWATGLGARIERGCTVIDLETDDAGVTVVVEVPQGRRRVRARYVVGCDGARSVVRNRAGIGFPGTSAVVEMLIADVAGCPVRLRPTGELSSTGMVVVLPLGPHATRVVVFERGAGVRASTEPPTFTEVADSFQRVTGEDIHSGTPLWTSYFTDSSRHATEYRKDRLFLAGDAAHIHLPIGAQGISAGIGDAANLGWKLAAEIRGTAPSGLLDTYHTERHRVGERIIANTLAQRFLYLGGEEMEPLRQVFGELLVYPEVQRHLVGMVTGLDIRYDMGAGEHPLLGQRMPDQDLLIGEQKTTTYELMRSGRGVLLDLHDDRRAQALASGWSDRVQTVTATRHDQEIPGASVLIRPDGYVAWLSPDGQDLPALATALTRWFGEPHEAP
jgi:bifunctional hydroxylase/dehydrase